jgi:hypothetical protein
MTAGAWVAEKAMDVLLNSAPPDISKLAIFKYIASVAITAIIAVHWRTAPKHQSIQGPAPSRLQIAVLAVIFCASVLCEIVFAGSYGEGAAFIVTTLLSTASLVLAALLIYNASMLWPRMAAVIMLFCYPLLVVRSNFSEGGYSRTSVLLPLLICVASYFCSHVVSLKFKWLIGGAMLLIMPPLLIISDTRKQTGLDSLSSIALLQSSSERSLLLRDSNFTNISGRTAEYFEILDMDYPSHCFGFGFVQVFSWPIPRVLWVEKPDFDVSKRLFESGIYHFPLFFEPYLNMLMEGGVIAVFLYVGFYRLLLELAYRFYLSSGMAASRIFYFMTGVAVLLAFRGAVIVIAQILFPAVLIFIPYKFLFGPKKVSPPSVRFRRT